MLVLVLALLGVNAEVLMLVGKVVKTSVSAANDSIMLSTVLSSSVGSNVLYNVNSLVAL